MYNRDVVNLKETVASAASRQDVRAAVAGVYARLQREIDARKPVCNTSGRCCRFGFPRIKTVDRHAMPARPQLAHNVAHTQP